MRKGDCDCSKGVLDGFEGSGLSLRWIVLRENREELGIDLNTR